MAVAQIGERFIAVSKVRAMIRSEIKRFTADVLEPAIGHAVGELVRECERRCTEKITDAVKEFRFVGPWQEGMHCRRGNFAGLGGAIYHCDRDTTSRPGTDSASWLLVCSKPRDGKDGKDFVPPEPPGGPRTTRSQR